MAGLALLFLACLAPHLLHKLTARRSPWPRRFLAAAGRIVGARVTVVGPAPRPHSLLLANHSSWIDILVLSGATGCRFVSKDTLGHGFLHWLADQNRTIYVRRSNRKGARGQADAIAQALADAQPVALFPEGTTGPGDRLLPFRSTLLEAAAGAPGIRVQPVAIDYGGAARDVGWFEESGASNVLRQLGRRGSIPVTVRLLEPLERSADRKALTAAARAAIENALAATLGASSSTPSRL